MGSALWCRLRGEGAQARAGERRACALRSQGSGSERMEVVFRLLPFDHSTGSWP
jgi:hypothetical protein